ncbi:hypothetical protein GDO81_001211 [Engystomops pustulosus]|uniref:Uncharacterized protein n=1 Tax=Engystomops pustulosus TaxID=76066 RepID=A0AAV7DCW8_ENGPU|nr:hypothetical protein GDO81_001211 [Engystomops pustulosus]
MEVYERFYNGLRNRDTAPELQEARRREQPPPAVSYGPLPICSMAPHLPLPWVGPACIMTPIQKIRQSSRRPSVRRVDTFW